MYDAIWSEFCDWGLEFAKVRLADTSLTDDEREATWWTLVEVLDTYLRLLHPVMPFITEALWTTIPHRDSDPELLIVARWPGAGQTDPAAETAVAEARTAGAEQYAADRLKEADKALQEARSKAQAREYRAALSSATEAAEKAHQASQAVDSGKKLAQSAIQVAEVEA